MSLLLCVGLCAAAFIAGVFVGANNPPKSVVKKLARKYSDL